MLTNRHSSGESRHAQLPALLRDAVAAHEAGELDVALPLYRRFVDQNPGHPTALQLLGLLQSQRGEYESAVALMRESLRLFPQQAEVANNLGNALSRCGRLDEALESYSVATRIYPRYADAWRNLGLCQLDTGAVPQAIDAFQRCLDIRPDDAVAWLCLGNAHKRRNHFEPAVECYEKALALRPDYAEAHHNLGVCLRMMQRPREALGRYESARKLGLDHAALHHNRGNALADAGELDQAIGAYRAAVERNPGDLESHRNLNSLLWQQSREDEYLGSYRHALQKHADAEPLRLAYAMALNQQGSFAQAEDVLRQGLLASPDSSELKSLLGYTLENQGRWEDALRMHQAAVAAQASTPNHRISYARALLACQRPDEALQHAKLGTVQMPFNQRALAYLGLCWRLLGDPRDALLNDYDNLVRVYDIPVPRRFAGAAEFNERLRQVLDTLHIASRPPPEQTVRGGTQTSGDLFLRQEQEIAELVASLEDCIRDYVAGFPAPSEHPLFARRSRAFRFAGSWSVRLARCGYHTMHVHPLGWISSAYYVQVPPEVADPDGGEGGIKFGEPDIDLGSQGSARRIIQPEVGRLVLFPSYMWHGTVPFESGDSRMTVAFDVVPAADDQRPGPSQG